MNSRKQPFAYNAFHRAADLVLGRTPLGLLPVRVRRGVAKGARWTLYPWTSYWRGTHEPQLQAEMMGLNEGDIRGWCCWDLGAHFGLYSVGLAMRVGPAGQVAAFEPNPLSYARLERHRRMNQLAWLKPYQAAVSDTAVGAELFTYGTLASTTTHLPYPGEARTKSAQPLEVRTVRLDDLVAQNELRRPRFVKIDVEGHGHHAMAGMSLTLALARPILAIGFHCEPELQGIMQFIRPLNYTWRTVGGADRDPEIRVGLDYIFTPVT